MLSVKYLMVPNRDHAIAELLENLQTLVLAGAFDAAADAGALLATHPGWRPFVHGEVSNRIAHILILVFALARRELPATAASPSARLDALEATVQGQELQARHIAAMPIRRQQTEPAGAAWLEWIDGPNSESFALLEQRRWNLLWWDAEFLLKARLGGRYGAQDDFAVSLAARNMPAQRLAAGLLALLDAHPQRMHYQESQILFLAVLDCLLAAQPLSAQQLAARLLGLDHGPTLLFQGAAHVELREWLATGALAPILGVDLRAIAEYRTRLLSRPIAAEATPPRPRHAYRALMNQPEELSNLLADTPFADLDWRLLRTDRHAAPVLYADCNGRDTRALWRHLHRLKSRTGRAPVLTADWGGGIANMFHAGGFSDELGSDDISVDAILAFADEEPADTYLKLLGPENEQSVVDWETMVLRMLDSTRQRCGRAPSVDEMRAALLGQNAALRRDTAERWLLSWELTAGGQTVEQLAARQPGFEAEGLHMLLLPTIDSWDSLAWMHWYGARATPALIALGRSWQQRAGAEVYAHFGTMFECLVDKPPQDIDTAWELACEQHVVAPYSLYAGGISTRELACGLMGHDHWFFHERP